MAPVNGPTDADPAAVTADTTQPDPVVVHADGEIVYANEAFAALVPERPRDDILESTLWAYVAEDSHEPFATQCERLHAGDAEMLGLSVGLTAVGDTTSDFGDMTDDASNTTGDADALAHTGNTAGDAGDAASRPREVIVVNSAVDWEGSRCIKSTVVDISGALSADAVVQHAINEAPIGITIADATRPDEPLIYVSDGFVEITGYDRAEALGRNCRFLQGEATRERRVDRLREAIDAGEPVSVTLRNYRKDGTMFWNRMTLTPITEAESVGHYLGYLEDVSTRKLYQKERELFETHAEVAQHTMYITDPAGVIEYVNPAFERMTGYSAGEAVGRTSRLFAAATQDPAVYEELWETVNAGETWDGELTNRRKSGERYRVQRRVVPICNDVGEITHFTVIEYNITEEAFTEQILDVMNRMLRHNVRNSIEVIEGYAAMLEDGVDGPGQRTIGRIITDRTAKLKKMSTQATAIRRLFRTREQRHSVGLEAVGDTIQQARERHDGAELSLTIDVDGEVRIKNGRLLRLALEESIENAVIHNDTDEPTVDVRVTDGEGATVRIAIADDGPGIPDAEWEIITSREETALRHSSGIGLWVIYWTATALGGRVERHENTPRGTVLTYELPTVADDEREDG